ncbi:MAG: preprotein translocase subunit YajC [Micromonosporaceae bacterium]|nr:preprotein translocase subunit YajC [Micromonosporaceae bacterium]
MSFLPFILIIVALYFLLIRPNNKRRREQLELQARLAPGDEIRTIGGLYGTVVATDPETVTIQAAPGVELRFAREAIGRVISKADEPAEETTGESDADGSARS